jgi:hypothetical protein
MSGIHSGQVCMTKACAPSASLSKIHNQKTKTASFAGTSRSTIQPSFKFLMGIAQEADEARRQI